MCCYDQNCPGVASVNGGNGSSAFGRGIRFGGGLLLGLFALPLVGVALMAGLLGVWAVSERLWPPEKVLDPLIWTVGRDIAPAGGATILIRGREDAEVTRQTCREACDDLIYWHSTLERIEVRDAKGRCIVCRDEGGALPFQKPKRWALGGRPLELTERVVR
jgi:hypothetical protein